MKQVEAEAQCLVHELLLAAAEKFLASGTGGADVAGRGYAARVELGVRRGRDVQKNLLAEKRRPNRLIAFKAIPVERVVPARLGVEVFARGGIAAIFGLRQCPPIGDRRENIGRRRQTLRRRIQDVARVGIQPMAEFAITAGGEFSARGRRRAEFRQAREPRRKFRGLERHQRNFQRKHFIAVQRQPARREVGEPIGMNVQQVVARRQRKCAEYSFSARADLRYRTGANVAKRQQRAARGRSGGRNRPRLHNALERGEVLRLLTRKPHRRTRLARLPRFLATASARRQQEGDNQASAKQEQPLEAENVARRARKKCLHSVSLRASPEGQARLANNTLCARATFFRTQ